MPRGHSRDLRVHRHADVRAMIAAAGCHLHDLPAYSPDCNPIELAVAKRKAYLRAFAPRLAANGAGLDRITAADRAGDSRHCGFALPQPPPQPS